MKKIAFFAFLLTTAALGMSFWAQPENNTAAPVEMKWYTWEEAVALNKTKPKKFLVDVYTDWCGWCKRMDRGAFIDPEVTAYMNVNFYPVKLNAEQKADIQFNNNTFKFVETGNGRGIHTLAYSLLDGNMSYPTIVYLNEKFERIMISPGYKESPALMKELKFAAEELYTKGSWEDYQQKN